MSEGHSKDTLTRLCTIEGHLRGLQNMVRSERPCAEILVQLTAVQGALRQVAMNLVEVEIERCMKRLEGVNGQVEVEDSLQALMAIYKVGWMDLRGASGEKK